jgi:putative ABC transport system permease protein
LRMDADMHSFVLDIWREKPGTKFEAQTFKYMDNPMPDSALSVPAREISAWFGFRTALGLAIDSILGHKLRSFLTLLGVIVGVGSVVLVGAAIDGLGLYTEQSTAKAFGTDSYLIAQIAQVGNMSRKQLQEKLRYNRQIRLIDMNYLRSATGDQVMYSPYDQRSGEVKTNSQSFDQATIIGVSASMPDIRDIGVAEGRFFTETEERAGQNLAVIGQDIVSNLFPEGAPLGKKFKVKGQEFTVIGVQEKLGSAFGNSLDTSVYVPYSAWTHIYGFQKNVSIFGRAKAGTGLDMEATTDLSRSALRVHFKAAPGKPDNFDILTPDSIRGFLGSILSVIAAVVVPVTMISLVVGGIVIMNIMLVSVTERTREIGIRKAIGAKSSDVLLQFLLEAVVLSAAGGAIGLGIGYAATVILTQAFDFTLKLTWPYVVLSLVVSTAVGVASGWYPAKRAARMDPIEALRAD